MPKTYLISGATQGIGRAVATRLLADGHTVLAWVREVSRRAELPAGAKAVGEADLADLPALEAALLKTDLPPLDGVILAAGYLPNDAAYHEISLAELQKIHAINLLAPQLMLKHLAPQLQEGATVVLFGSVSGHKGSYCDAYAAAKAGVHGLVRSLALKLAPRGIRVVGLAPGITDHTGMTDALKPGLREKTLSTSVPLGVASQPEDLAAWVALALSAHGRTLTGAVIDLNGGQYLRT